jgi:hypothetical protein
MGDRAMTLTRGARGTKSEKVPLPACLPARTPTWLTACLLTLVVRPQVIRTRPIDPDAAHQFQPLVPRVSFMEKTTQMLQRVKQSVTEGPLKPQHTQGKEIFVLQQEYNELRSRARVRRTRQRLPRGRVLTAGNVDPKTGPRPRVGAAAQQLRVYAPHRRGYLGQLCQPNPHQGAGAPPAAACSRPHVADRRAEHEAGDAEHSADGGGGEQEELRAVHHSHEGGGRAALQAGKPFPYSCAVPPADRAGRRSTTCGTWPWSTTACSPR